MHFISTFHSIFNNLIGSLLIRHSCRSFCNKPLPEKYLIIPLIIFVFRPSSFQRSITMASASPTNTYSSTGIYSKIRSDHTQQDCSQKKFKEKASVLSGNHSSLMIYVRWSEKTQMSLKKINKIGFWPYIFYIIMESCLFNLSAKIMFTKEPV